MKVKLAQCWDDGPLDDIRLCEILRKYKAMASFNLNPGLLRKERYCGGNYRGKEVWKVALPEVKDVYEGFLVANHTFNHPHLTQIPPDHALREITEGRDALEQLLGYPIEGFAYPYGDQNADVRELVEAAGHVYARVCDNTRHVLPIEDAMDFKPSCHFLAENFWEKFDHASQTQNVFYFWGHSYEIQTEDHWIAFEEKIKRLGDVGEWVSLPSLFQCED
jgi:peptidoglycan/xylan/chitin deacetylase (PgdA/CDA1 family)